MGLPELHDGSNYGMGQGKKLIGCDFYIKRKYHKTETTHDTLSVKIE